MNHENHEAEDFKKKITFESGQFAIIDADVAKSLKDQKPLEDKIIFVPIKQSSDMTVELEVVAKYDDASLKKVTITPTASFDQSHEKAPMDESVQLTGHGGDPVERKVSKIDRTAGESRPKTAHRSERNKRYSAGGDPKIKLTKGRLDAEDRIKQAVGIDGARRSNYGQPKHKINNDPNVESECIEFIQHIKDHMLTEKYLDSINHLSEIKEGLVIIRNNFMVEGKAFDLVYDAINTISDYQKRKAQIWVEDVINKGLNIIKED